MKTMQEAKIIISEVYKGHVDLAIIKYRDVINDRWLTNGSFDQFVNHYWAFIAIKINQKNKTLKGLIDEYKRGRFEIVDRNVQKAELLCWFRQLANTTATSARKQPSALASQA